MKRFFLLALAIPLLACASNAPAAQEPGTLGDVTRNLLNPGSSHVSYDCTNGNKFTMVWSGDSGQGRLEEMHLTFGTARAGVHFVYDQDEKTKKTILKEMTEILSDQKLLRHVVRIIDERSAVLTLDLGNGKKAEVTLAIASVEGDPNVKSAITASVGGNPIIRLGFSREFQRADSDCLVILFLVSSWAAQFDMCPIVLILDYMRGLGVNDVRIADAKGQVALSPVVKTFKTKTGQQFNDIAEIQKVVGDKVDETAVIWRRTDKHVQKVVVKDSAGQDKHTWQRRDESPWTIENGVLMLKRYEIVLAWDPTPQEKAELTKLAQAFSNALFEAFDGQAAVKEVVIYPKSAGKPPTAPGVAWMGKTIADAKSVDPYAMYCFPGQMPVGLIAYTYASNPLHGNPMYLAYDWIGKKGHAFMAVAMVHEFMHSYWGLDEEYLDAARKMSRDGCPSTDPERQRTRACVMDNKGLPELCRSGFHSTNTAQHATRKMDCATFVADKAKKYLKVDLVFGETPSLNDAGRTPPVKMTFK